MKPEYLFWASAVMAALFVFAVCILLVGYKPLSMGRAMTMALLAVGSVTCFVLHVRRKRR